MQNILLAVLAIVVLLWTGLRIWRQAGARLMEKIQQNYRTYYLSHMGESGEAPLLVVGSTLECWRR